MSTNEFRKELEKLINHHSCENESNTPDFILAKYLSDCLKAFDTAVNDRSAWYGRKERDSNRDHIISKVIGDKK